MKAGVKIAISRTVYLMMTQPWLHIYLGFYDKIKYPTRIFGVWLIRASGLISSNYKCFRPTVFTDEVLFLLLPHLRIHERWQHQLCSTASCCMWDDNVGPSMDDLPNCWIVESSQSLSTVCYPTASCRWESVSEVEFLDVSHSNFLVVVARIEIRTFVLRHIAEIQSINLWRFWFWKELAVPSLYVIPQICIWYV